MARIALYVTESDERKLRRMAGEVPLSKWCRKKLFENIGAEEIGKVQAKPDGDRVPPVREDGGVRVEGRGSNPAVRGKGGVRPKVGECKHGTKVGEYCGFCFGIVMPHMAKGA
jgi:hypothetical protein